jgi:YVTN family beta-propeller protein
MAELPAGTVTFLFTDIEGSTRLLKTLRDGYGEVLAEHERILRDVIGGAGGQVVDTQGDAVFAAFSRVRDAVSAALAAQRTLAAFPWPEGGVVRVRMGIHSGEPAVGKERYVGLGVHRAARICSAAHGGQVLLSGATRELVEDALPDGMEIEDLSEHRLKDIDRPEHLFQLVAAGLAGGFPPPRTEAGEAAALTSEQERELAEAAGALVVAPRLRSRGRVALLAGGIVAAAVAATAAFVLSGGTSRAAGIAANSVGFIDAHGGRVGAQVPVEAAPTSAAFGAGTLWVANANAGTVSRVDPVTQAVRQTIPVGDSPSGIAVGGGGVWVANHDDDTVAWINPQSNTVVREIQVGSGPTAVVYGYGSVWVTNADDRSGPDRPGDRKDPEDDPDRRGRPRDRRRRRFRLGDGRVDPHRRPDRPDDERGRGKADGGDGPDRGRLRRRVGLGRERARQHRLADRRDDAHGADGDPRRRQPVRGRVLTLDKTGVQVIGTSKHFELRAHPDAPVPVRARTPIGTRVTIEN